MKKSDRQYWINIQIQEDVIEWSKNNPSLIKQAIENLKYFIETGSMPFLPWMAGLFVQIHNPVISTADNKENYQLALNILESL